jgi:hypothetical protein
MSTRPLGMAGQALHVLRADLRRHAPLLATTFAVLVLHVAGVGPSVDAPYDWTVRLPAGLITLLLAAVAGLTIQADGPARGEALWMTLPLHRGAVLLARFILLAVCLWGLPLALQTWWFAEIGAGEVLPMLTADSAVHLGAAMALGAAAGSVTRTPRGLLALAVSVWLALAVERALGGGLLPTFGGASYATQLGWLGVGASVLVLQLLGGRAEWIRAVGVLAVMAVPVVTAPLRDPVGSGPMALESSREIASEPPGVAVRLEQLTYERLFGRQGTEPSTGVQGMVRVTTPAGHDVQVIDYRARIWRPGLERTFTPGDLARRRLGMGPSGPQVPAIPGLRPAGALGSRPTTAFLGPPLALLPALQEEVDSLGSASLAIGLTLSSHTWTIVGRLTLEPGAATTLPSGETLTVGSVRRLRKQVSSHVQHRWTPASTRLRPGDSRELMARYGFVLVSRRYGEFLVAPPSGSSLPVRAYRLVGGAALNESSIPLEFTARSAERGDDRLPDDWFDDVEILVLERSDLGTFEVEATWEIDDWPRPGRPIRVGREGVVTGGRPDL